MTQINAYRYIHQRLEEIYFHGEWQLQWYEPNPYFELTFQMPLSGDTSELMMENIPVESVNTLQTVYEFRINFYDGQRIQLDAKDGLASFVIHPTEGICQGDILAILTYVKQLQARMKLKWHEFMAAYPKESFEVVWDDVIFEGIKDRLKRQHRYSHERLVFKEEMN